MQLPMKKFTFSLTGASPYEGWLVVITKTYTRAVSLAVARVNEENKHRKTQYDQSPLEFRSRPAKIQEFDPPCVVEFVSGEA